MSPPYDYPPDDKYWLSEWAQWISPHWGYLVSAALAVVGAVYKAASLVTEIRALRKDNDRLTVTVEKFMDQQTIVGDRWRAYVDSKFDAMNTRLDNLADK